MYFAAATAIHSSVALLQYYFAEAGNAWDNFRQYNPYKLNRSVGVGVRLFLPMFGLMGLDYGVGFDKYDPANGITKFKDLANFTFMLGFEPD